MRKINAQTQAALDAIRGYAPGYDRLAPVILTYAFGRAACASAFRIAKREGLIEVAYLSAAGTPVYRRTDKS